MKVYTHITLDLDAAASVWAAREFIPGAHDAEVVFKPANWNGAGMNKGDLALDIVAGGRGIKGREHADGSVGSCFVVVVERYASTRDQDALDSLLKLVERQDASGSAVKWFAGEADPRSVKVLDDTGLNGVLRAYQANDPRNDALVVERMSGIFSGMLANGRAWMRAVDEAAQAEGLGKGPVVIVRDQREFQTNSVLFDHWGVRVIVYADGYNLGVIRQDTVSVRMDDPALRAVVEAAGEEVGDGEGKWFAHPAGFLFARGTRKAPATTPSRVRPEDLAEAAAPLLASDRRE
jgi:hypothetical protein